MLSYDLNIIDNIYHMNFIENGIVKIINLNTKNYIIAKDRAEKYKNEYLNIGEIL